MWSRSGPESSARFCLTVPRLWGCMLVVFVIRKFRRKEATVAAAGPPAHDPLLDRYHDQIEKEVEKLD